MKKPNLLILLFILACSLGVQAQDYDVYLCIGQSNCAGRGPMIASDTTDVLDGVYLLNAEGKPEPAKCPLNRYSNIRKDMSVQMFGLAWEFAKEMRGQTSPIPSQGGEVVDSNNSSNNKSIKKLPLGGMGGLLLVQNAKGGSWLKTWQVGGDGKECYIDSSIVRCKQALKYGKLKGIIWHQGCTDIQKGTHKAIYVERFKKMIAYLREQLGVGNEVPVIVGEVPQWAWANEKEIAYFNDTTLVQITKEVPNCKKVDSDGLVRRYDNNIGDPHFSRESYIELGHRYAQAMLQMQGKLLTWYDGKSPITISTTAKPTPVVDIAKNMLADDLKQVTGKQPTICTSFNKNATICAIELDKDKSQDKWLKSLGIPVDSIRLLKDGFLLKAMSDPLAPASLALPSMQRTPQGGDLSKTLSSGKILDSNKASEKTTKKLPLGGLGGRLLVIGSNGRGTAYGLLEVSRMAGVSPWIWWGDVKPQHKDELTVAKDFETIQSPSVEFRGIFINDEDWTLQPWAWQTFDPVHSAESIVHSAVSQQSNLHPSSFNFISQPGMMSVNVYREIFKVLLRLRGNMIWPGMHGMTTPFYKIPGAKECADSCGIVIGTSHCEPLMRNNVGEWNVAQRGRYNYITNKDQVLNYWTERLKEAGQYENFYTIGMRGIHDGEMEGVKTKKEKVDALNAVIKDQRDLLTKYVVNDKKARKARGYKSVDEIPQVFVPYKEVLQIMEAGVDVPEDVTLMWCDDNYGYMTRLSDSIQQQRKGGGGIYYHLSYWGRPHDYMWLTTTQPGLIYSEMKQAYDHNVRKSWIVNVHDLKAPCYDLELFMDLAWNIEGVKESQQPNLHPSSFNFIPLNTHLENWLCREFGTVAGEALLPVMKEYYRLTTIRKPEFMGWNQTELDKKTYERGNSPVHNTEFSFTEFGNEAQRYINDYAKIRKEAERIGKMIINKDQQDAYFAHILYPVSASAYMAEKMLYAQQARQIASGNYHEDRWKRSPQLEIACAKSQYAYQKIRSLTEYYNDSLAHGKWKYMMCDNPRDLYVFWAPSLPMSLTDKESPLTPQGRILDSIATTLPSHWGETTPLQSSGKDYIAVNACDYDNICNGNALIVEDLGHSQNAVSLPKGTSVSYDFVSPKSGDANILLCLIPTQANDKGDIRIEVTVDGQDSLPEGEGRGRAVFSLKEPFRSETWKTNVLRGQARFTMPVKLTEGKHTLTIKALDDHIILDQWMLDFNKDRKFYVIPVQSK